MVPVLTGGKHGGPLLDGPLSRSFDMKKVLWFIAIALMISIPAYGWIMAPVVGGVASGGSPFEFGYTTVGGSSYTSVGTARWVINVNTTPITAPYSGTCSAVAVYVTGGDASLTIEAGIYNSSLGKIQTGSKTGSWSEGWNNITLSSSANVTASTEYVLATLITARGSAGAIYYDVGSTDDGGYWDYANLPETLSGGSTTRMYSIKAICTQ